MITNTCADPKISGADQGCALESVQMTYQKVVIPRHNIAGMSYVGHTDKLMLMCLFCFRALVKVSQH